MKDKALAEAGWKTIVTKYKIKDNGLQRALAEYERVDEDDHTAQLAAVAKVNKLAAALQRDKDTAELKDVVEYLEDIQDGADAEQKEVTKAKVTADKAEAIAKKQEKQEDAFDTKLGSALQKLKSSQGLSYPFISCEGPDGSLVLVAPAIQAQHRQQVIQMSGGRKVIGPGTCKFEDGKYVFMVDRAPSSLAKKLQAAIQNSTGRRVVIEIRAEAEVEDDDT